MIARGALRTVYQPIFRVADGSIAGFEALTRFPDADHRTPDRWFAEADAAGLGIELELAAVRCALRGLAILPRSMKLAINLSPAALVSPELADIVATQAPDRLVLEVTEHAAIEDYAAIARALAPLRGRVKLAVDDAGAGFASLRHILHLEPDVIKLDISLTRGIDADPAKRALAAALLAFCRELDCIMVAEGVETAAELAMLRVLGVDRAQGFHLARPVPLAALASFLPPRSRVA
ncbi:MAG: EAL domain-containing protein [Sphingomonas sp.]